MVIGKAGVTQDLLATINRQHLYYFEHVIQN